MEAITDMKNATKSPTWITFKDNVSCEDNSTKLLEEHPFRSTKYAFEYMKKGITHVQIVFDEEDTHVDNSKEL